MTPYIILDGSLLRKFEKFLPRFLSKKKTMSKSGGITKYFLAWPICFNNKSTEKRHNVKQLTTEK